MNKYIRILSLLVISCVVGGILSPTPLGAQSSSAGNNETVTVPEDLMREHGVLRRLMLVYEEIIRRIDGKKEIPGETIEKSAGITKSFVENYHEKLEEDYLFTRMEKSGKMVELARILKIQHDAGRRITGEIEALAKPEKIQDPVNQKKIADDMRLFITMYRPHAAREDTVLFPVVKTLFTSREFNKLGELFEAKEHQMFGDAGFEGVVNEVNEIEKTLGINDLSQFTPKDESK